MTRACHIQLKLLANDASGIYNTGLQKEGAVLGPNEIRINLRSWVEANLGSHPCDVFIDELGFSNRREDKNLDRTFRADLALANGRLVGFEIKSGNDSLSRWPSQCEAYFRVFDEIWLCTHSKHLERALSITPKETGIIIADDFGGLVLFRKPSSHKRISLYDLSGLLWRDELLGICEEYAIDFKRKDTKSVLREKVSHSIEAEIIRNYVLQCLKVRKSN